MIYVADEGGCGRQLALLRHIGRTSNQYANQKLFFLVRKQNIHNQPVSDTYHIPPTNGPAGPFESEIQLHITAQ